MSPLPIVAIELIPDPEQGGYTAHIPDIPAYGEGATEAEAIADLKTGIQAYVEENGLEATLLRLNSPTELREMNFSDLVAT